MRLRSHLSGWRWRGSWTSGSNSDADDDKRIINNTAGTLTPKRTRGMLERVFRRCNNRAQQKLVLCGSGFLEIDQPIVCRYDDAELEPADGGNVWNGGRSAQDTTWDSVL